MNDQTNVTALGAITLNPELQPRAEIDRTVLEDYVQLLVDGAIFPPVTVFAVDGQFLLASGCHRWHGHNVLRDLTICMPSWPLGHPRDLSRLGIDAGRLRVLLCYVLRVRLPPRPGA